MPEHDSNLSLAAGRVAFVVEDAKAVLDRLFGEDYAASNPVVVAAFVNATCAEASRSNNAIADALESMAHSLGCLGVAGALESISEKLSLGDSQIADALKEVAGALESISEKLSLGDSQIADALKSVARDVASSNLARKIESIAMYTSDLGLARRMNGD